MEHTEQARGVYKGCGYRREPVEILVLKFYGHALLISSESHVIVIVNPRTTTGVKNDSRASLHYCCSSTISDIVKKFFDFIDIPVFYKIPSFIFLFSVTRWRRYRIYTLSTNG